MKTAVLFSSSLSFLGPAGSAISQGQTHAADNQTSEKFKGFEEAQGGNLPPRFQETSRDLLLPPERNSPNAMIVVILPGAKKQAWEYSHLAQEIQKKSSIPLWLGIAKFTGNLPNPFEASSIVKSLIEGLKKDGFAAAHHQKTFLAGHSMGGIMAQGEVKKEAYAGLILFSSYLTRKNGESALPDFPMPVLTVSGELDGLTRVTRISLENEASQRFGQKAGENIAAARKPVIVVKGVNHSQVASETLIKGDLLPEETYLGAQEKIAQISANFVLANSKSDPLQGLYQNSDSHLNEAVLRLLSLQRETSALLHPFELSKKAQSQWCGKAQILLAEHLKSNLQISVLNDGYTEKKTFIQSAPSVEAKSDTSLEIHVPSLEINPSNPFDFSIVPEGTTEIDCKLYVPNGTPMQLGNPMPPREDPPMESFCQYVNLAMYEDGIAKMSEMQRLRFQSRGKKLTMNGDLPQSSESRWLNAPIKMTPSETDKNVLLVQSPAWFSLDEGESSQGSFLEGMEGKSQYNCKVLSPSRIFEWMIVDSFK